MRKIVKGINKMDSDLLKFGVAIILVVIVISWVILTIIK